MAIPRPRLPSIRSIPVLAAQLAPPLASSRQASSQLAAILELLDSSDDSSDDEHEEEAGDVQEAREWGTNVAGRTGESADAAKVSARAGRKLTAHACVPCKKYHTQCSEGPRPCAMCVRRHRAHLCVDAPPKSITENAQEGRVPASRKPRPSLSRTPLEAAAWHASRPTSSTSPYHRRPSPFSAQRIGRLSADSNLGRRSERTASPDSRYRHSPRLDPNTLSSASSSSLAGPVRRSNVRAALDSLRHRWSGGHSDLRAASCSRPAMQDSHPAWAYDEQHSYV